MPTEKPGHLLVEEAPPTSSAIENELPTYRAICNRAVFGLLCGVLASFSYANLGFLIFAVLAVALGLSANVAIKRNPDILTGRRLANAGIALGLIFGLTVLTYTTLQSVMLDRDASKFAQLYGKVLKEGSFGDALLYRQPPQQRENKTAEDAEKDFEKMKARERGMIDIRMAPLTNLRKAAQSKDSRLHFVKIESKGVDEGHTGQVGYFATALFEVEGPTAKNKSGGNQFALVLLKGQTKGRHYEWWVDDVVYPYAPSRSRWRRSRSTTGTDTRRVVIDLAFSSCQFPVASFRPSVSDWQLRNWRLSTGHRSSSTGRSPRVRLPRRADRPPAPG